jgi:excisionase family DNA binding protein
MTTVAAPLLTVEATARRLGVSVSTVWRMLRRRELTSVRERGRRLIPETAVADRLRRAPGADVPPFTLDHPFFRLVGSVRCGGSRPGARDKHAVLDE